MLLRKNHGFFLVCVGHYHILLYRHTFPNRCIPRSALHATSKTPFKTLLLSKTHFNSGISEITGIWQSLVLLMAITWWFLSNTASVHKMLLQSSTKFHHEMTLYKMNHHRTKRNIIEKTYCGKQIKMCII